MSELPKAYQPAEVESKWYQTWLDERFRSRSSLGKTRLLHRHPSAQCHWGAAHGPRAQQHHSGHSGSQGPHGRQGSALVAPVPTTPALPPRSWWRKSSARRKEKTRHDIGREKFLEHVWEWKEKHGGIIINQLKKLGASCDWSRERFTMDEEYSRCVQQVFVELHRKGLIYRGKRMVKLVPGLIDRAFG